MTCAMLLLFIGSNGGGKNRNLTLYSAKLRGRCLQNKACRLPDMHNLYSEAFEDVGALLVCRFAECVVFCHICHWSKYFDVELDLWFCS